MVKKYTTNEFLKECMADSLMKLMKNERFDKISITEITQTANVGRVTFYRNFDDKKELIIYKFTLIFVSYFEDIKEKINDSNEVSYKYLLEKSLNLIYMHKDDFLTIYKAGAFTVFQDFLYEGLWAHIELDEKLRYRKSFYSYALYGTTLEWVKGDFSKTPKEILELIINNLKLVLT